MNYIGWIRLMIESIKEQQQQIVELKQLVNKLLNRIYIFQFLQINTHCKMKLLLQIKRLLFIITATCIVNIANAQAPSNDDYAGANNLNPSSNAGFSNAVAGTLIVATASDMIDCSGQKRIDSWYMFTNPRRSNETCLCVLDFLCPVGTCFLF